MVESKLLITVKRYINVIDKDITINRWMDIKRSIKFHSYKTTK